MFREGGWVLARVYLRVKGVVGTVGTRLANVRAQTSFEYFLLAAGVAILTGVALMTFGKSVQAGISQATVCLNTAQGVAGGSGGGGTGVCS